MQPVGDVQEHVPALEYPPPLTDQILEGFRRAGRNAQDEVVVRHRHFLRGGGVPPSLGRPKPRVLDGRLAG